jgi:hypothetical protein
MIRTFATALLMITIILGSLHRAYTQDSVPVVILSRRVGPEISATEREYFHLFPAIERFHSARVIKTPDGKFEVRARCLRADGQLSEYVVTYSLAALLRMAEKINHFEDLMSGDYRYGIDPATLQVINSKALPVEGIKRELAEQQIDYLLKTAMPSGLKPGPPIDLHSYPRLRFGAGFSTYSPGTDEVNLMLRKIEQAGRDQGYPVRSQTVDLGLPMFYWFTLGIDVASDISVELEAGKASDDDLSLKTASLAIVYYFNYFRFAFLRPFARIGITNYNLEAHQEFIYGARKAPDPTGGYSEFYSVSFNGISKATAPSFDFGLETIPTDGWMGLALRVGATYVNCPNMSVTTEGGYSSALDMKRLSFGATLFFYF